MIALRRKGRWPAIHGVARQRGQGVVEYGLILALAVVVCIVSLLFFSDQLSTILRVIASAV